MNKRKLLIAIGCAFLTTVTAFNVYQRTNQIELSEIALENVMALANDEFTDPGNYYVDMAFTDYTRDGVVYKQTKIVDCTLEGSSACKSGKYYRYKKDNGEWREWTPT